MSKKPFLVKVLSNTLKLVKHGYFHLLPNNLIQHLNALIEEVRQLESGPTHLDLMHEPINQAIEAIHLHETRGKIAELRKMIEDGASLSKVTQRITSFLSDLLTIPTSIFRMLILPDNQINLTGFFQMLDKSTVGVCYEQLSKILNGALERSRDFENPAHSARASWSSLEDAATYASRTSPIAAFQTSDTEKNAAALYECVEGTFTHHGHPSIELYTNSLRRHLRDAASVSAMRSSRRLSLTSGSSENPQDGLLFPSALRR